MTAEERDKPAVGREKAVRSLFLLALALLAVFPLFAYFGYRHAAMDGVWAAVIAALLNGAAALLALLAIVLVPPGPAAAGAVLAGTLFRLALPLGTGLAIVSLNERLADAGLMYQILGFYIVALIVETLLAVRLVPVYGPTSVRQ